MKRERVQLSRETEVFIEDYLSKLKKVRKAKISEVEMSELLDFTAKLAGKYEEILDMSAEVTAAKVRDMTEKHKKFRPQHFAIGRKDYLIIDNILFTNKFDGKPKVKRINGKNYKYFDSFRIKKVARMFYVAYIAGTRRVIELLQVPDVRFVVRTIMNDKFDELHKFLDYIPSELKENITA